MTVVFAMAALSHRPRKWIKDLKIKLNSLSFNKYQGVPIGTLTIIFPNEDKRECDVLFKF